MKDEGGRIDLTTRTRRFAIAVIRLYAGLCKTPQVQIIGKQLLRAGTSVGAHYREATRARSTVEFVSKLNGGRQELEETMYWLELLEESGGISAQAGTGQVITSLHAEANELMAILTVCVRNAKNRGDDPQPSSFVPRFPSFIPRPSSLRQSIPPARRRRPARPSAAADASSTRRIPPE